MLGVALAACLLSGLGLPPPAAAAAPGEAAAYPASGRWRSWKDWLPGRKTRFFPLGDVFSPPLADQRQPRFHATWQHYHTDFGSYRVGSVGFGENIGLIRWPAGREGDGLQFGISGAALSLFNLDASSYDLLNTDYIIGFPLSFRRGHWSARGRLFHQSSHLGDEFLLNSQPLAMTRINLSFEELELLGSWDWMGVRLYGGPSRILSTSTPLKKTRAQGGGEYRSRPLRGVGGRFVFGAEWSGWEETSWKGSLSVRSGLLFESPFKEVRSVRLLAEYYDGDIPHGQFYRLRTRYYGFGVSFAL